MQVYGQRGGSQVPAAPCVAQAGFSPSPGCSPPSACPKAHARSCDWCSLLPHPPLLRGDGLEQNHASSSPALWDVDADCPIPLSGWAAVPKYPKLMLASGKKFYCLVSDNGQLAGAQQGAVLGSISAACPAHMQNLNMHLHISEQALTTDPHGSGSPWGCRVGSLPAHPQEVSYSLPKPSEDNRGQRGGKTLRTEGQEPKRTISLLKQTCFC